jgi:two-component system response regulator
MVGRILLIEDNRDDVELTLHVFRENGLAQEVAVVRDGAEALDYLFAAGSHADRDIGVRPEVVLLDLGLPKIGGLEVLRRMRGDERTKWIPVVILTTSDDEDDIANGYDLGANSYIRKPVDFDAFAAVAKQLGLYWLELNTPPPS